MNPNSPDVIELSKTLIALPSVSKHSNFLACDYLAQLFRENGFEVEWLEFTDELGERKVSLVAKKGSGSGGLGFFSHIDTVPGAEDEWPAFKPVVKGGRLFGRGSCDMKGPLAATIVAAVQMNVEWLEKPVTVVVTADEENGFHGAFQVSRESQTFQRDGWPDMGVIAEPSELVPVYAHKGGHHIEVTANGRAAHTSTDEGVSSNFLIAPFLSEMADLAQLFKSDPQFMNAAFDPPTNGFNMTLNDGDCAGNVTAAKTICKLNFRPMPDVDTVAMVNLIKASAQKYALEVSDDGLGPFYVEPDAPIVRLSLEVTGRQKAITVPYGTEALIFAQHLPLVILGPGSILQAHTVGEWIELAQLERSVEIYKQMIDRVCCHFE